MRRLAVGALAAAVLTAGPAFAVAKGGKLYAKCNPTKVQKSDSATGATVATLKVGDELSWEGPGKKKPYHSVTVGGKNGFVDQACLSPSKPSDEYATSGGAAISAEAFKSSAAATKGLSEGAIKYADAKGNDRPAVAAQLVYVEENTKNKANPGDPGTADWAKKAGVNLATKEARK